MQTPASPDLDLPRSMLGALVHGSPLAILLVDPDWTVRFWNAAAERLFGWSEAEVRHRPLPLVPEDARAEHEALRARLSRGEALAGLDVRCRRKDGSPVHVSLWVTPVRDPAHGLTGMVAFMEDITERRRVDAALRESERRYRLLAENVTDVIWVFDSELRLTYVSPSVTRLRGYSVEELLPQSLDERLTPASLARARELIAAERPRWAAAGRAAVDPLTLEIEMPRKGGGTVWVEAKISPLRDDDGRIVGVVGVSRDVTERRGADQQLRLQAAALHAAANAILITDRDGRIEWANPAFTRLTGYSADEVRGRTPRILKSGEHDPAFYATLWRTILAGDVWHGEVVNRRRDGSLYTERETITPVRDAAGALTHFVSIKQDVTPYKQATMELERQRELLHQNEKLAAMGQLLAGVAHELNNPLAVVLGQAFLLQERPEDGVRAGRVARIVQAAERCARIVRQFLALARQRPPERRSVALNQVVEDVVELMAYPLRVDSVTLSRDLAADLPTLWADPDQLHQVLINLLTNAHYALRQVPGPRRLSVVTRFDATAQQVCLEVADTGPGIAPEVRARIFEPFFTTKPPGQGTGLGLSLCRSLVEAHGGTIRLTSAPGQGATFWVELPVTAAPVAPGAGEGLEAGPLAIRDRAILVADDEGDVAAVIADILTGDGHRVDVAANGAEALDRLGRQAYDVVVSDTRMPELDGPGLYREAVRRQPALARRFVFLTGDSLTPDTHDFLRSLDRPSVPKPFVPEDVRRAVQQVLRAAPGP